MPKIAALCLFLSIAGAALPAGACHPVQPVAGRTDRYETIFVGEVTGIRLRSYENSQLGRPDVCTIEDKGEEPICFNLVSDKSVTMFVLPRDVIRGDVTDVLEVDEAGCNKPDLALHDRGIFFVNPGGHSAAVVWASHVNYQEWLQKLGVSDK